MIELYYFPTPNCLKITLFLEETGLPYRVTPIDIRTGGQFNPIFQAVSPNSRIPAITDHAPIDGGKSISIFESGAILLYLAEKTGKFLPADGVGRIEVIQWLFWQMAGLGPMAGQSGHFRRAAPQQIPYALQRYADETARLYGVLDRRLADRPFIAGGAYSIADMASYPWIDAHEGLGQSLGDLPYLSAWLESIRARPATVRAIETAMSMRKELSAAN
ncbi:glutathione binding-like protein [Sphingobium boeckii]|uniref:GST-like protein n=1 Tax=Sphingobium boeckii TaxID=1082345 RepID=A0A7W9AG53_9SPHN|nr:GST-like protein [Sphingobium boeckii]